MLQRLLTLAIAALVVDVSAPLVSAAPILIDTTTQGSWNGVYGGDGYILSNFNPNNTDLTQFPTYINGISYSGEARYTWDAGTTDVRAVQAPSPNQATRKAATTYSNLTATLDVNKAADFQLAIYALDWDSNGSRVETIQVSVAGGPAGSLDSVTQYQGGKWYVYNISAASAANDVTISLVNGGNGSANAVISAIMFDAVPEPASLGIVAFGALGLLSRRGRRGLAKN